MTTFDEEYELYNPTCNTGINSICGQHAVLQITTVFLLYRLDAFPAFTSFVILHQATIQQELHELTPASHRPTRRSSGPPDTSPHHRPLCIVWLSLSVILRCAQQQHLPNNARPGEQFWHTVCQVGRSCASPALKASHCTSGTNVSCHGKQGHEEGSLTLRPRLDTAEASQRVSSDGICRQRNRPPKLMNNLSRRIGDFTQHKMRCSILSTDYTREACKPPGSPIYSWDAGTVIHRPYEPAMIIPSSTETRSLTCSCGLPRTSMGTYDLPNPKQSTKDRYHRTATLEHRQTRP